MVNCRSTFQMLSVFLLIYCLISYASDHDSQTLVIKQDIKHDESMPLQFQKVSSRVSQYMMSSSKPITLSHRIPSMIDLDGFQGLGVGFINYRVTSEKPDTMGSVGVQQYVQWVNNHIAVFDKTTGHVAAGFPKAGNALWSGFGGACEMNNMGLTTIKYDQLANRWAITQYAYANAGPFYECIAISTSENAAGSYYRYAFQLDGPINYARFALWPDAYYMAFNMQTSDYSGTVACAIERTKMLQGLPATMQCKRLNTQNNPVIPADLDGILQPPAGNPEYFLGLLPPYNLLLSQFHVDFDSPINTRVDTYNILVKVYGKACPQSNGGACAIQPSTDNQLDMHSDQLMHRFVYKQFADHGSLVATHTIIGPWPKYSPTIRWYELRLLPNVENNLPVIYQQGSLGMNSMHRFLGSIALDKMNNIAIGYNVSSTIIYPSLELAVHETNDPINTMTIQPLITGIGSQTDHSKWGSVSTMSIDPADDCTFWYTGEYLKRSGSLNWSTFIVKFKLANCT